MLTYLFLNLNVINFFLYTVQPLAVINLYIDDKLAYITFDQFY